jgi:hypothetical protein
MSHLSEPLGVHLLNWHGFNCEIEQSDPVNPSIQVHLKEPYVF